MVWDPTNSLYGPNKIETRKETDPLKKEVVVSTEKEQNMYHSTVESTMEEFY